MNLRVKKIILLLLLLGIVQEVKPLIIGSNTLVSLESLVTFPEIDILFDNIIRAFAWMKNGFKLENSDTELEFQSTYPVLGTVDLRGGTLTLDQDLIFKNVTTLDGLGIIYGQGHAIKFCSSITQLPDDTQLFDNVDLFFDGNIAFLSDVTFSGNCLINGNNNNLDLTNGSLKVDAGSIVHLRNINVHGIQTGKLYCEDDTASIILENMDWVQESDTIFNTGTLTFKDQVTFSGTGTFVLSSKFTSTILEEATVKVTNNIMLSTGRHAENNAEPIFFESESSVLYLDNVGLEFFDTGACLTNGTVIFNRNITLDFLGTTTQTGSILGNGNPENDIHAILNPGTSVNHRSGYWVYNNGQKDRIKGDSISAKLIRHAGSEIFVAQDLEIQRNTVELVSNLVSPIIVSPGVTLSYLNSVVKLPDFELDIKANQLSSFVYQLDGSDSIFFTRGTLPLGVVSTGQNNVIKGNGGLSGPVILSDSTAQLTVGISGDLFSALTLNSGMVQLSSSLSLNGNGIIHGPGIVDIDNLNVTLSRTVNEWPTPISWLSSIGEISLQGALSLKETWTFSGNITLNGNGNILTLSDQGGLTIDENSSLTLKDIQIKGVSNTNIKCLNDAGKLSFFNGHLFLDADYSFTTGAMIFEKENSFSGESTFSYESAQTSTIATNGSLICSGNLNLKLGKVAIDAQEPLVFTDTTSVLMLDQATLNVQPYGYQLTKGTFVINNDTTFSFDSTHTGNGLVFGNGIEEDDITIQLNPGCTLNLAQGHLVYNLSNPEKGFVSQSQTAQVNRGSTFITHFAGDADLNNITFAITPPALFTQDPGKQVTFTNVLAKTPVGQFNVTGRRVSIYEIALDGGDTLELQTGQFPLLLSVSGINNTVSGEGAVNGVVTLADSATQLISALSGLYLKTIVFNNGTCILGGNNTLGDGVVLTGPGTVVMGAQSFDFGNAKTTWQTPLLWQGTDANIGLHAQVSLQSTWTVSGNVTIKGHGFGLDLADTGQIVLDSDSTLTLEDVKVGNLSGTKIKCVSSTGKIIMDNARLELGGDYHFTQGSLSFKGKNTIKGVDYIFGYETNQTSTLQAESLLMIDQACTFSYAPGNDQDNLIEFEDDTSVLMFRNSSLISTHTGLQLNRGMVEIQGDVSFSSYKKRNVDGSFDDPGIRLGDGFDQDNDILLSIDLGSILQITKGSLRYNNLAQSSLTMGNQLSRIQLLQDTTLYIDQNINLGDGVLLFKRGASIKKESNKTLTGSMFIT